jgi:hypothetical protein
VKVTVIATGFRSETRPRVVESKPDLWSEDRRRFLPDATSVAPQPAPPVAAESAAFHVPAASLPAPPAAPAPQPTLPIVMPVSPTATRMVENADLFPDDGMLPHLDQGKFDKHDYEIPAFLRRMQD